jgi:hypothetical protein
MAVKLLVYKIDDYLCEKSQLHSDVLSTYKLSILKPKISDLHKLGHGFVVNLFWYLITFGKFEVLQLTDSENIVHFSYISPKVYRFPFMKTGDIQIGPCLTFEKYQKRGIYSAVLQYLISEYCKQNRTLWIYCNENNEASRKTIEKVGFKYCGNATINKLTKVIKIHH